MCGKWVVQGVRLWERPNETSGSGGGGRGLYLEDFLVIYLGEDSAFDLSRFQRHPV